MNVSGVWQRALAFVSLCVASGPLWGQGNGELTFAVEPNYDPARAQQVYQPLVDYVSRSIRRPLRLVTSKNYHFYWSDLRSQRVADLVYDEPHFTDYRIERMNFEPLVKTLEPSQYVLVSTQEIPNNDVQALVARSITSLPAPSLGFALLIEFFPNPMQQPDIRTTATSWRDTIDMMYAGEADAAIVPVWLQQQDPALIPVVTSRQYAGTALSAGPNVDPATRQAIREALLKLHEDPELYEVINELGVTQFVPASKSDFAGASRILRNFFGYQ